MAFKSPHRMVQARRRMYDDGVLGTLERIFKFDPDEVTFTAGMAKRTAPGPFETAPIVQGKWDSTGTPDVVQLSRGNQIHGWWYQNFDPYQYSVSLWITPEWNGNDGKIHYLGAWSGFGYSYKAADGKLWFVWGNGAFNTVYDASGWTAGTTYHVVLSVDTKNTLDGTNVSRVSVNDVHSFSSSVKLTQEPLPAIFAGTNYAPNWRAANAIIEGFTIYRRPLFDGTYGVAANWDENGPIDEIAAIYAAGAGQDPCLVTGSWDIVFCLPTDSVAGALTTGTGQAWSHPHNSGVLEHQWLEDGGYLGRPWAVAFNGSNTSINCGSGATLDDICAAGADITIEGWFRHTSGNTQCLISKDNNSNVGWRLFIDLSYKLQFRIYLGSAFSVSSDTSFEDDKWHHFAAYYNDVTKTAYLAIDGIWESNNSGAGVYGSDAAINLKIGVLSTVSAWYFTGAKGWYAISNNDRYGAVAGTDFIPPRQPPATDGNHVEMWHLDEGTGATANAEVTSPANDGTISNGTWEEQWDIETTPIVPYSLEFDATDTSIAIADHASIQDLADNAFTAEVWTRLDSDGENNGGRFFNKGDNNNTGWTMYIAGGRLVGRVQCATTDAVANTNYITLDDGKWHHAVMYFDDAGDRKLHFFIDGIEQSKASDTAGVGAIISDIGFGLQIGNWGTSRTLDGQIGYARVSDTIRWTVDFTPPSRLNPPGVDGNTVAQWNFRDGPGTTLLDETANNNDGTITLGTGGWNITPDMEIDSPGERIFNWGYVIGNDAVNEGIIETLAGLVAGQNYVVRAIAHIESASRGRPKIIIRDETNGADITSLEGPSFTGAHDGLANSATLTDTTARFPQMLVGWTIYNITDGSSATITAISGDMQTITGALSGGTEDDWDIGDEYRLVPPGGPSEYDDYPWIETFTFELPTIARNGAAADCVSISVKMVNGVNEGVIKWHQIELLENLIDNPSLETGAGNPWVPDGWLNTLLDAGDTEQDVVDVHSGGSSVEWNVGAVDGERLDHSTALVVNKFYSTGLWVYGDDSVAFDWGSTALAIVVRQDNPANKGLDPTTIAAKWIHNPVVLRCIDGGNRRIAITSNTGASADRFSDDVYVFELDDVSLTVTPASEANSAESGGLRVDGRDACTQPIPAGLLTATSGWVKFKYIPRHDGSDMRLFGNTTPYIFRLHFDGNHFISVFYSAVDRISLQFNDGGGVHVSVWNATGLVADTEYLFEVKYNAAEMILKVDGVIQATITTPINFANILNSARWGHNQLTAQHSDAVFIAP